MIQGIILAGGMGRRVGGCFKGGLNYQGVSLIQHVVRRIQPQAGLLAVNANHAHPVLPQLGLQVFADHVQWRGMGPLAGLATSFTRYPDQWLFFAPVDMPLLPEDVVSRLWQQKGAHLYCYAQAGGRDHPLVAVAHSSLLPDLVDYLAQGNRRVMGWLARIEAKPVAFPDASAFLNLNHLKCFT